MANGYPNGQHRDRTFLLWQKIPCNNPELKDSYDSWSVTLLLAAGTEHNGSWEVPERLLWGGPPTSSHCPRSQRPQTEKPNSGLASASASPPCVQEHRTLLQSWAGAEMGPKGPEA